MSWKNRK